MLNASSELRVSYSAYRTAYDLAAHYQNEVIPMRTRMAEENQYSYNGMLISVFELFSRREATSRCRDAVTQRR